MAENGRLPASDLAAIPGGRLRRDAAKAWNEMNHDAESRGVPLRPTGSKSSYRTYAQQEELWSIYQHGGNLAAVPGTSNHGWGIAVDLATPTMRGMVDKIGERYGWSKRWSDAPGEWWHIRWSEGRYEPLGRLAKWRIELRLRRRQLAHTKNHGTRHFLMRRIDALKRAIRKHR